MLFNASLVYAAQTQQAPQGNNALMMMLMIGSLVFVFYLLIMRPQKRQEQERKKLLSTIEKGDKVLTIGGIYGTIVDVDDNASIVTLEVAKNVKMDFSRTAVSQIIKRKKQQGSDKDEDRKA